MTDTSTTDFDLAGTVRYLADRQAILDCLHRYTRGVDRLDRALTLSAYHPDAIDDHGTFRGGREAFVDWAFDYHGTTNVSHHHIITNHSCEIDGDVAHAETYYLYVGENRVKPNTLAYGRYVDRLEKRDGKWGIVWRTCINESVNAIEQPDLPAEWERALKGNGVSSRDPRDISYDRPLGPDARTRAESVPG